MKIEVAGFVFDINNKYSYSEKFMKNYLSEKAADYSFGIEEETLFKSSGYAEGHSLPYLEYLECYREICNFICDRDGIMMHGAVIEFDNKAYMFTAPSGTGKTTHIKLWKKVYGDRVKIINGDKPLIRHINGEFIVYGTPWSGKEHFNRNASAPLGGIILLSRGEENSIEKLPCDTFNKFLFKQIYMPQKPSAVSRVLDFADNMFSSVPLYHLYCNISEEAVTTVSDKIRNN